MMRWRSNGGDQTKQRVIEIVVFNKEVKYQEENSESSKKLPTIAQTKSKTASKQEHP